MLCLPQGSSITGASPLDCLVSYQRHLLGWGVLPLCRDTVGLEKLGQVLYYERRIRGDLIETYEIICNYGRHFHNISPQIVNLLSRQISEANSRIKLFANRGTYFWHKLPQQIKNNNTIEKN